MPNFIARAAGQTHTGIRVPRVRTFASLKYTNYRYLWGGTFFSSAGDWIQQVTLGWLMYELTGSAFLVGALQGVRGMPALIVGPVSGVFSDRMDRRKLLLANQVFLAVLALALATLVKLGDVRAWHLLLFTALNGVGFAMNNPLRQALVANTVPREALPNAIALTSTAFNVNRMLGPALGGLLIAAFGPATNFFIQAACYASVVFMVLPMRTGASAASPKGRTPFLDDLKEGLAFIRKEQTILALILLPLLPSLFLMPFTVSLMPVYSKEVLHLGPEGLGLLLATLGVGGLVGTLIVASLGVRSVMVQVAAGVCSGLALIAVSRLNSMPIAIPFLVALGTGHMLFFSMNNTVLQSLTPDSMRGRVMSISLINFAMAPLGSFAAGLLAHRWGTPMAMLIGGLLATGLLALIGVRFRRALGRRERSPAPHYPTDQERPQAQPAAHFEPSSSAKD